jgi:adenylate kinase family enzyme
MGARVGCASMKRIAIIGVTGSGKTTLAQQIAKRCGIQHVELDALRWEPEWTPASDEIFRQRVDSALSPNGCWVCDGNYSAVRDIVWRRADTVIWLNYPLRIVLWRLMLRTLTRLIRRELLWGTNRETIRNSFFTKDSLFIWAIQTHPQQAIKYPAELARPEHAHFTIIRLKQPLEAKWWLSNLPDRGD